MKLNKIVLFHIMSWECSSPLAHLTLLWNEKEKQQPEPQKLGKCVKWLRSSMICFTQSWMRWHKLNSYSVASAFVVSFFKYWNCHILAYRVLQLSSTEQMARTKYANILKQLKHSSLKSENWSYISHTGYESILIKESCWGRYNIHELW